MAGEVSVVCCRMAERKPRVPDGYGFESGGGIAVFEADSGHVHLHPLPSQVPTMPAIAIAC